LMNQARTIRSSARSAFRSCSVDQS
jgi:hypothetical protein